VLDQDRTGMSEDWTAAVETVPGVRDRRRGLAARGESPAAFGRRCIPPGCVAPRSNTSGILTRRALPAGRIAALGATPDFHHGLLERPQEVEEILLLTLCEAPELIDHTVGLRSGAGMFKDRIQQISRQVPGRSESASSWTITSSGMSAEIARRSAGARSVSVWTKSHCARTVAGDLPRRRPCDALQWFQDPRTAFR
jgi:hypothetical protein